MGAGDAGDAGGILRRWCYNVCKFLLQWTATRIKGPPELISPAASPVVKRDDLI